MQQKHVTLGAPGVRSVTLLHIRCQEDSKKVLEGGDQGEGYSIVCGRNICPRTCILLYQELPLPFLSPAAKVYPELPVLEGLMQQKHVTLGAPGVRLVTLLQDHYCVPIMAVRKVNPEVSTI